MDSNDRNGKQDYRSPTAILECPGYLLQTKALESLSRDVQHLREHSDQKDEETERGISHLRATMDRIEKTTKDEIGKVNKRIDSVRDDLKGDIHDLGESISRKIDQRIEAEKGAKARRILTWILSSIVGGGGIVGILFWLIRQFLLQFLQGGGTP